ncbi:MAG: aminotransferase class V-fold PLP-dependent enzyme [Betaproteobacteria bacterium]|nr:aminotransferase class V-fold PLP-dependent enzyme [Betaproteobacteria bacterium]
MILLNPGPVTLSPGVRRALAEGADLCHREAEFAALTRDLLAGLEAVYEDAQDYAAALLTGSGTCGVEAMLATFAPRDRPTLVAANGVYGERMAEMLRRQGKPLLLARSEWAAPIDLEAVRRLLDARPDTACVAAVHHETTTGRLNDLTPLAALCRERGAELLIDAVSSFGGEEIPLATWRPLALAGTANKCLHGIPGLACVLARRAALEQESGHAPSLYLDLGGYYREQRNGFSPFTQAVQAAQALHAALAEFAQQGGWGARRARYQARTDRIRARLAALGVAPLLPAGESAAMLTAYLMPAGRSYEALHDSLKAQGFVLYAGQGPFHGRVFRIATMGEIGATDLERLETALTEFFA